MKLETLKNATLGLVLSGGGIKGMAHIGLLKALTQRGIYPDQISGVSAGALVGGLYADGASIEDMLLFFQGDPTAQIQLCLCEQTKVVRYGQIPTLL